MIIRKLSCFVLGFLLVFSLVPAASAHQPHDNIHVIAVSPGYETDRTVFCYLWHINNFILKSTDGGETWYPSQIGIPDSIISGLALSPAFTADRTAFIVTEQGELYRSIDGCATWEPSGSGLPGAKFNCIAISPSFASDSVLFVGTETSGIFKSIDRGTTFSACNAGVTDLHVNTLAVSPAFDLDGTLFAGTDSVLLKSVDAGATWFNPTPQYSGYDVMTIALSPAFAADQELFVGTWGAGVFKSTTGGSTWVSAGNGLTDLFVIELALSPSYTSDRTALVATKEDVFKTMNGGISWWELSKGLDVKSPQTDYHYFAFGFSPGFAGDRTVFLASWEGVHVSEKDVSQWRHLDVYNQNLVKSLSLSPDFASDGTLFAAAYGGGIYRSTDHGDTWVPASTGLRSTFNGGAIAVSPAYSQDHAVFVGMYGDLTATTRNGNAWFALQVNPQDTIFPRSIAISSDFANDGTLFFTSGMHGTYPVYKSVDSAASFTPIDPGFTNPRCIVVSPDYSTDRTVYAGALSGVYRSQDGGSTWEHLGMDGHGLFTIDISPNFTADGVLFVGTLDDGVFKTSDRGLTWTEANNGLDEPVIESLSLSPAYGTDGTLFAAAKSRGVFKSTDGGGSWQAMGLEGTFLRAVEVSPDFPTDQTVFLGAWDGVYRSVDGGSSWSRGLKTRRYDDRSEFIHCFKECIMSTDTLCSGISLK